MANAPVLSAPDFDKPFELWTDASTHGIGSVLMQDGHPIAYESRKLSSAEFNNTTTEQELLAVVHSLKVFRPYIQSEHTTQIFTDHRALEWLLSKPDVSRREARWLEEISRYNLKLSYIPGRINVADPVSRVPALMCINTGWLSALTRAQAAAQARDMAVPSAPAAGTATPSVLDSAPTPLAAALPVADTADEPVQPTVAELLTQITTWYSKDPWFSNPVNLSRNGVSQDHTGMYYRDSTKGRQLVIPNKHELRTAIIREHHDPPYAGHRGRKSTEHLIQRLYWWPDQQNEVRAYVDACASCQANKPSTKKPSGIAKSLPTPEKPWERFSMDWMTDFPVSKRGFDSILVVVDYLTKLAHFIPCHKEQSAEDVAKILRREIIRLHGVSEVIVSDRDPKLVGAYMQDLFKCLGVKHTPSTAFRPQTDGQTERMNRVIQEMLRNYVSPMHDDWDEYLDLAEFAYNNAYHESIKTTPFRLTYGYDPRSPLSSAAKVTVNVDGRTVSLSYINSRTGERDMRSTKANAVNIPVCHGALKYYLSPESLAFFNAIAPDGSDPVEVPECPAARKFTSYMQQQLRHARMCLDEAKQRQRAHAQKRMVDASYLAGEYVWLSTVNLRRRLHGCPKLMPKFCGPFKITKVVNETTYELVSGALEEF